MKRISLFVAILLLGLFLARASFDAGAAPSSQLPQFSTPTPGADGRIIYIVQEGDSCIRISYLTGVSVDQLRALNKLDENCSIFPNQQLILGIAGPSAVTPTPGPAPTATPVLPTPTASPGSATVCVLLYEDLNGDGIRQADTEAAVAGSAVSVTSASGQFSQTGDVPAGADPVCFEKVPEGTYTISAAAPQGYNATTRQTDSIEVKAGDEFYVGFGAQKSTQPANPEPSETEADSGGNILGILGAVLVLGGIVLGAYYWFSYVRGPKLKM
jgi:LysM repeat protein